MQQVVHQIQGLSGSESDLINLKDLLKQSAVENVLKTQATHLLDALHDLDPHAHSLGCLYLLEARARHAAPPQGQGDLPFVETAGRFLEACNASQVKLVPRLFASLCSAFRAQSAALGRAKHAILPLKTAMRIVCPQPGSISPIHVDFLLACLLSKCYAAAAEVLDEDAYTLDPAATGVTATDVLLYCYYGGMLETGRRRYSQAIDLYLTAVTAPTNVVNAITIACLKKLILVSLLVLGHFPPLPKHVSSPVARAMKADCGPYLELAKLARGPSSDAAAAAEDGGAPAAAAAEPAEAAAGPAAGGPAAGGAGQDGQKPTLVSFAGSKAEGWRGDGNAGLVRLVVEASGRRRVQALTHTYRILSVEGLAQRAGLATAQEAELQVLRMVEAGELHARISDREGAVEFAANDPDAFASAGTAAALDDLIQRCMTLAGVLSAVDHSVSCDKTFLSKTEFVGRGAGGDRLMDRGGLTSLGSPMGDMLENSLMEESMQGL